jgi:hypothetical protein
MGTGGGGVNTVHTKCCLVGTSRTDRMHVHPLEAANSTGTGTGRRLGQLTGAETARRGGRVPRESAGGAATANNRQGVF